MYLRIKPKQLAYYLTSLTIIAGLVFSLFAADHADSPDTSFGNLDINDYYIFNHGSNIVLALTVSPLLAPGSSTNNAAFNPDGLYQFKFDKDRDGVEEAVIQITFDGSGTSQKVNVYGPGKPSKTGTLENMILDIKPISGDFNTVFTSNDIRVFAGPRDDPFFFHGFGDSSLTSVLNAAFTGAGIATGAPEEQSLAFSQNAPDNLAGLNVLGLVIEIPKSMIAQSVGITVSDIMYSWATTSQKN